MGSPGHCLELPFWDQLDHGGAEDVARSLANGLPEPWRFVRVQRHQAGEQQRFVAYFTRGDVEFALVPGGRVFLGFDRSYPPDLTEEDWLDWDEARSEYGDLHRHLDETMTPLRRVEVAPLLVEVASRQMDEEPLPSGWRRTLNVTFAQVRESIERDGFRLPTSDEWEHACRAGTRTFWWWGNRLAFPIPDRNGFGLDIARDTYCPEWCTHPHVFRGGDGGTSCCGGLDGLPTTLRLASAYFEPLGELSPAEYFAGACRRVFPLSEAGSPMEV